MIMNLGSIVTDSKNTILVRRLHTPPPSPPPKKTTTKKQKLAQLDPFRYKEKKIHTCSFTFEFSHNAAQICLHYFKDIYSPQNVVNGRSKRCRLTSSSS